MFQIILNEQEIEYQKYSNKIYLPKQERGFNRELFADISERLSTSK